jgi:hypothetical protein
MRILLLFGKVLSSKLNGGKVLINLVFLEEILTIFKRNWKSM